MEHGDLVNEIQEARAKTMFSLSEVGRRRWRRP